MVGAGVSCSMNYFGGAVEGGGGGGLDGAHRLCAYELKRAGGI